MSNLILTADVLLEIVCRFAPYLLKAFAAFGVALTVICVFTPRD